ncbi:MAG: DUF4476 domain-containing protein [Bacteroidaceae bacterium]|nr:DUF4476 domain-containing protein [Bacteroidaceae bacterium]
MKRITLMLALSIVAFVADSADLMAQTRDDRYMMLATPQATGDAARSNRRAIATSRGKNDRRGDRNYPRRIDRDQGGYYEMMVSDEVVRDLIRRTQLSSDRLKAALRIIDSGGLLNSKQIFDIAGSITFESDKLKFLKAAYPNCIDRERYYIMVEKLSFISDKKKLCRFIIDEADKYRFDHPYGHIGGALRKTPFETDDVVRAMKVATMQPVATLLAKAIVLSYEELPARELAHISESLVFDSDRLDFLVWAYGYCYDPQNYLVAEQTLEFMSNRDRLFNTLQSRLRH